MRVISICVGALLIATPLFAQKKDDENNRYGVEIDKDAFPQATAKEALRSVLKAADAGRFDYLLAHLADPAYVEKQIKENGTFQKIVGVVKDRWTNDPENAKEMRRMLADGFWEETPETATVKLKDVKSRQLFLKKIGPRWYLENRQKAQQQP